MKGTRSVYPVRVGGHGFDCSPVPDFTSLSSRCLGKAQPEPGKYLKVFGKSAFLIKIR